MSTGLNKKDKQYLDDQLARVREDADHMIGYPATRALDFSPLYPFFDFLLNNLGDPYTPSSYRLNTHEIECEVIEWFTELLHGKDQDIWGYVTSGGTEGNMYGVYLARELFPNGMVYYSEDTHYSVAKILRMVNSRSIMIKSQENGEMDYQDLAETIAIHRDVPPVIFANIGTTMKGAIDNLDEIKSVLKDKAITRYYLHADAALSGMVLPFTDNPQPFDFADGVDSISISGHKFPGVPIPCGIVLAKRSLVDRVARTVEYIGTNDTTVLGSRNGMAPLFLWYVIHTLGKDGFQKMVKDSFSLADYAIEKFKSAGIKAWRHKNSPIVVFPRMNEPVTKKWQIAIHGNDAHLIVMPHVTKDHIDQFLEEIIA